MGLLHCLTNWLSGKCVINLVANYYSIVIHELIKSTLVPKPHQLFRLYSFWWRFSIFPPKTCGVELCCSEFFTLERWTRNKMCCARVALALAFAWLPWAARESAETRRLLVFPVAICTICWFFFSTTITFGSPLNCWQHVRCE